MHLTKALPVLVLLSGCLADVQGEEPVGDALEPGLSYGIGRPQHVDLNHAAEEWARTHSGPCADACFEVGFSNCSDAHFVCDRGDAQPYDAITCADHLLTCADAKAASGGVAGLSTCWRSCENLH